MRASLADWHVRACHRFAAGGDGGASEGTAAIQQPMIAPRHDTQSEMVILANIAHAANHSAFAAEIEATADDGDLGYAVVQATWTNSARGGDFDTAWNRWLHDGVLPAGLRSPTRRPQFRWNALQTAIADLGDRAPRAPQTQPGDYELLFSPDYSVYDGRFGNNSWLQELPDPITKLTWDNAALMSLATSEALGVANGDVISVSVGDSSVELAAWVSPGTADGVLALPLGYGREVGRVATGCGTDVYGLRTSSDPHFYRGARVETVGREYQLATTQHHHSLVPRTRFMGQTATTRDESPFAERPLIRRRTLAEFREDPHFVEHYEVLHGEPTSLNPSPLDEHTGQMWALSIDLTSCNGCNACVIACQSENNISVVGKERVADGREMHWLRVDRYYSGDPDDPELLVEPMPCQQCENAPCEAVCPVGATAHSPEGLNDMAYNRCIGTRYCANNCPYKVRRFNFFNYTRENHEAAPDFEIQRNPNVTLRFRGVMEKCTYCTQRIAAATIAAHNEGHETVADGQILTACAQACPTRAIVFGDKNDPDSMVTRLKAQERDYVLLKELNDKPRTSYMARIRNPNPDLVA